MKWKSRRIDTSARIVSGATPSTSEDAYWDGDIPWVTPKDLSDIEGAFIHDTPRKITQAGLSSCSAELLPAGSVLFSSRAPIGHVAINTVPMATNQGFKSFIPDPSCLDAGYLYHWLRANKQYLQSLGNGATFKEVSKEIVSRIEIPLPPLEEQRRIAAILDRADSLCQKRQQHLVQLDLFISELFYDWFSRHLGGPAVDVHSNGACNGWRRAKLTDVARLATGHTPDRKRDDYWNGSVPWLSLSDIRRLDGKIATSTSENVTELGIAHSSAVKLPAGTVCFSRTASVGFVTIMGREMATSQDFVNWVCGPELDPIFLMYAFIASRRTLLALSNGSTHRTIYFPTVEEFQCVIPPIAQQRKFADVAKSIYEIKKRSEAGLDRLDKTFTALQYRAFRGEL